MGSQLLSDAQFTTLARLAQDRWGLELQEGKRVLVDNRISRLMRAGRFESVDELLEKSGARPEGLLALFDALSTHHTSFYRESAHFDCLRDEIARPAAEGRLDTGRRLRFWSAACSNGSEPYTLAAVLHDHLPDIASWDVRILATDLSASALNVARRAVYPKKAVANLSAEHVRRHFERRPEGVAVRRHLRELVTFGVVNLIAPWNMQGPFDAIFCRNVMIYFDAPTKARLVERLTALLRPGGLLFVGSSESLVDRVRGLELVVPSAYRKVGPASPPGGPVRR